MKKVEVGKKYKNLHTGRVCEVIYKEFFNVAYRDKGEPTGVYPHYCHYKKFQKNWIMEEKNE